MNFNDNLYRPCVGIMLLSKTGKIFAANRIDYPGQYWQMPQGGIEADEDILLAAKRELLEETSISSVELLHHHDEWLYYDLPDDLRQKLWNGKYVGQKQKWHCFAFTGDESEINIHTEHPEFIAWQWMDIDELSDYIVPFKRKLYQEIIEVFSPIITAYRNRVS